MNKSLKYFSFIGSFLVILTGCAVLSGFLPAFESRAQGTEAISFIQKGLEGELAVIQDNSLLPISEPASPEKVVGRIRVIVTAYSSTPEQTDDTPFITAAGTKVREGVIANNYLPFGTRIKIPELFGDQTFVVEDRMSWKKGNYHFDVWLPSYQEALHFGAKNTLIEILEV